MNYLVGIQNKKIGSDINSVSAKELHGFLEVKLHHSTWIKKRIEKFGFIENEDYIVVHSKKEGNNATIKEYYITLDMAKELSMVENNPKGREARQYFIKVEKEHRENLSLTYKGKSFEAIIRGYKSQLSQHIKKIELQAKTIDELIAENATLALPAPAVDVEPYKEEVVRLQTENKKVSDNRDFFRTMAGNQVLKTIDVHNMPDTIEKHMRNFLDYPNIYNMLKNLASDIRTDVENAKQNFEALGYRLIQ